MFADHDVCVEQRAQNRTAVAPRGGLSVEVNKQRRAAAQTAGGYAHLGWTPAALLCVHSCLPLNCGPVNTCEWTDMTALAFLVQLLLQCVRAVIANGTQVIRAGINGMSCLESHNEPNGRFIPLCDRVFLQVPGVKPPRF